MLALLLRVFNLFKTTMNCTNFNQNTSMKAV